jgi:hypothetical protein
LGSERLIVSTTFRTVFLLAGFLRIEFRSNIQASLDAYKSLSLWVRLVRVAVAGQFPGPKGATAAAEAATVTGAVGPAVAAEFADILIVV